MSESTPVAILAADPDQAPVAASIIADAFAALDLTHWLVPDDTRRHAVLARNMLIWTTHAGKHGLVSMTADQAGVAVWFPVAGPLPEPDDYTERLAVACGPWIDRFRQLDATFDAHHPHEPHHYLAFLAVRPGHQGRGIGTALLDHHHELYPDVATYLEASSRQSRRLYLRHGFVDRGVCHLPDGPPLWPMWRPADG